MTKKEWEPQLGETPQLSKEEELELFRQARDEGSTAARQRVISSQLPLAMRFAVVFARKNRHHTTDFMQAAFLGVARAFDEFEPERGARFSTVAKFYIRIELNDYAGKSTRAVPIGWRGHTDVIKSLREGVRDPAELAARHRMRPDAALAVLHSVASVDTHWGHTHEEDGLRLEERYASPEAPSTEDLVADLEVQDQVWAAVHRLPERHRDVISMRYLGEEPWTMKEVAERLGNTKQAVDQMEKRVLAALAKDKVLARLAAA